MAKGNELRKLRLEKNIPAKDMVVVVRAIYPKYDKTMQSKCENGDEYGVSLRPDAMNALYEQFAPEQLAKKPKRDNHRLKGRVSCRLEDADFSALQQRMSKDGYTTAQNLLTELVRQYLNGEVGNV